jgi:hypothetical protein
LNRLAAEAKKNPSPANVAALVREVEQLQAEGRISGEAE